jgi:hypothetical protein
MASQMVTPLPQTVLVASWRLGIAVRPPSSIKRSTGLQPFSAAVWPGLRLSSGRRPDDSRNERQCEVVGVADVELSEAKLDHV